jgi:hypothetical protein
MLAYIFWHRPYPNTERQRYERAIVRFQNDLAVSKPPGFIGATSFQIEAVPWLSDLPGYEDWYLLDGTWAMDPLNAFAISGHVQATHDSVAALMEQGHGGLYAHAGGESVQAPRSTIHWLTRPRGIQWQPAIEMVRGSCPQAQAWRRQMVLGPAAEFAIETPAEAEIDVPAGWQRRRVTRMRLPHALLRSPRRLTTIDRP